MRAFANTAKKNPGSAITRAGAIAFQWSGWTDDPYTAGINTTQPPFE